MVILILSIVGFVYYVTSAVLDFQKNYQTFFENFMKGMNEYSQGFYYEMTTESTERLCSQHYKNDDFDECISSAEDLMTYSKYAYNHYINAKNYFNLSLNYASSDSQKKLVEKFIECSDLNVDFYQAVFESGEYRKEACEFYKNNKWVEGNEVIEKLNEVIRKRDSLVKVTNDCYSYLQTLIENY
jgi:predicted AlkP superfamily phosphohydrolase/phosphomutase